MPDVLHSSLGGSELHEPKGVAAATNNQTYVADGAASGAWGEPEPKGVIGETAGKVYVSDGSNSGAWSPRAYVVSGVIADIGTAGQIYLPIPYAGNVVRVTGVLGAAISGSDETITVKDNAGNAMGAITVASASSAAGDVDVLEAPASNQDVTDNDWIEIETLGNSTGPANWTVAVVIERTA